MSAVLSASAPTQFHDIAPVAVLAEPARQHARPADEDIGVLPSDRQVMAMRAAYRATGGFALGDDLARLLSQRQRGDFVSLARLIVSGEVFGFQWRHAFWIPLFQFDLRDMTINPGSRRVLPELAGEFDGWELANWFATANSWLDDRRPVDVLATNLRAVLEAARADRFVASG